MLLLGRMLKETVLSTSHCVPPFLALGLPTQTDSASLLGHPLWLRVPPLAKGRGD